MRFATFEVATPVGPARRVGVVGAGGHLIDVNAAYGGSLSRTVASDRAAVLADAVVPPDLVALLGNGPVGRDGVHQALTWLGEGVGDATAVGPDGRRLVYDPSEVRLLAPVPRPASLRDCAAFEDHVRNTAGPRGVPAAWYDRPVYYKGNPAAVCGPDTDVVRPAGVAELDYELEFAFVIGRPGRDIDEGRALDHVGGYMVFNDVSARDTQREEMRCLLGPAKGKDFDGANVLGPHLVTPDEFDPGADHAMVARIDGEEWSRGTTAAMYFSVARIVSALSRSETLQVGDVIGAGTVGSGCGLELGRYPPPGSVVELEVEELGLLRNKFAAGAEE